MFGLVVGKISESEVEGWKDGVCGVRRCNSFRFYDDDGVNGGSDDDDGVNDGSDDDGGGWDDADNDKCMDEKFVII